MNITHLKHFIREIMAIGKHYSILKSTKWQEQFEQYRIIKSMHTFEKGLSLKNPRPGFGKEKILALIERINRYQKSGFDCSHVSVQMAMDTIGKYCEWNSEINQNTEPVNEKYNDLLTKIKVLNVGGGVIECNKEELLDFEKKEFDKVILSRHSIRNFGEKPVAIEDIKEAIAEANRCPSACNRQPTKVHIVASDEGKAFLTEKLQGVGGFADSCSAFLLITGSVSAFDFTENNQWLVSGAIFAGYLTLTLHARKIASCVIQRTLVRDTKSKGIRNHFNIPDNEELICAIGVGSYPDKFTVPASVRFKAEDITTIH